MNNKALPKEQSKISCHTDTFEFSPELLFLTRSVIGAAGDGRTGYQTPPSSFAVVDSTRSRYLLNR